MGEDKKAGGQIGKGMVQRKEKVLKKDAEKGLRRSIKALKEIKTSVKHRPANKITSKPTQSNRTFSVSRS